MGFDAFLWRHYRTTLTWVRNFKPDVIHVTGPGDVGLLGVAVAKALGVYVIGSWHTNLHDFAACRLQRMIRVLPGCVRTPLVCGTRRAVLWCLLQFYQVPRILLVPNQELVRELDTRLGRSTYLLPHGVDTEQFSPSKRRSDDGIFRLGYVGRIVPEKNIRALVRLEQRLIGAGHNNFRFVIVGDGSERRWLQNNLKRAEFRGVLRGEELAETYADMDLFVFPSETDTFGLVVLEALASGVPCVVTRRGGPQSIVRCGVSGFAASDEDSFATAVVEVVGNQELHRRLRCGARHQAEAASWDRIFEDMWQLYGKAVNAAKPRNRFFFNSL